MLKRKYHQAMGYEARDNEDKRLMSHSISSSRNRVRQAVYDALIDISHPNILYRNIAEERIKALETKEEFGLYLGEISMQENLANTIQHSASILLMQYVNTYWRNPTRGHPLKDLSIKKKLRLLFVEGLSVPESKIRNAFAYCVMYIGDYEYDSTWPTFFADMESLLNMGEKNTVLGVLKVHEELVSESHCSFGTDDEMIPIILDHLYSALQKNTNDKDVRIAVVQVLSSMVKACGTGHHEYLSEMMYIRMSDFFRYFGEFLQDTDLTVQDYALKGAIMNFLMLAIEKINEDLAFHIQTLLPYIWTMVMNYGQTYIKTAIRSGTVLKLEDDDKLETYTSLVQSIFDFIHSIVKTAHMRSILIQDLSDIMYYIIIFLQITNNMEEIWRIDPLSCLEGEDCYENSVRLSAKTVLTTICSDFEHPDLVIHALCSGLHRHLTESEAQQNAEGSSMYIWKLHEACMFTLGSCKNLVIEAIKRGTFFFDLLSYLANRQMVFEHPEADVLLGRTLWFAGKFSVVLSQETFNQYMQVTISHLNDTYPVVFMQAMRAILCHCEDPYETNPNGGLLIMSIPTIFDCLIKYVQSVLSSSSLTAKAMEALCRVTFLQMHFALSIEIRMTDLVISLLLKFHNDPDIIHYVRHIITSYCSTHEGYLMIENKLIPEIVNVLNSTSFKIPSDQKEVAMDLLQHIMTYSKVPPSDILLLIAFPAVVKCILNSDDDMVLVNGGECLRCLLILDSERILNYRDFEGSTGLDYVLKALSHLLDPSISEQACKKIGRLIVTLFNKSGVVLASSIHFLLRAILSKMQRVDKQAVWQSLLLVFIYLFYTQMDATLAFLTSVPGPTGTSALEFVLVQWFEREPFITGFYERVMSAMALKKIIEHSVTFEGSRFEQIMIRNTYNPAIELGEDTICVPARAFKAIVTEVRVLMNRAANGGEVDSDDDWADDAYLDPDQSHVLYSQDPIFQINILDMLTDFLQQMKGIARFPWFTNYLGYLESQTLNALGIKA